MQLYASVTNEPLTIASIGRGIVNASGANVWASTSPINLAALTTFEIDGVSLDLQCWIYGSGGFTKTGAGTLTLSGNGENTYTGATEIDEGTLQLNQASGHSIGHSSSLTIGDGLGAAGADVVRYINANGNQIFASIPITINNSGLLDLNGHSDDVGPIYMDGSTITTGAGQLQLVTPPLATVFSTTNGGSTISGNLMLDTDSTFAITNTLTVSASISGSYALMKTGPQFLYLTSSNSYSGLTVIQQGWIYIENGYALGSTANGTVVSNGATLAMNGNFGVSNESLTLNGPGEANWGALDSETDAGGTNVWTGPITLNSDSTLSPYGGGGLRIIAPIGGQGGFSEFSPNNGTLFLEGATDNTYAGLTTVNSGTLLLKKASGTAAIPGDLVVTGTARLGNNEQIVNTADVLINGGGLFDFATFHESIDTLHGPGNVSFGSGGSLEIGGNNGTSTFDGIMSGIGFPGGYTVGKFGTGTFTLNGNNTYQNGSDVFGGTLIINGDQPQSPILAMSAGTTLAGSGTVGDIVSADGSIAPGNSPGILTCSNAIFTSSGAFLVQLAGPNPGTDYDQLNVRGTVNLAGASLGIGLNLTMPVAIGRQFTIINNDGSDAITGIFGGYPEGSTWTQNGYTVAISYVGGTGNDVVLTLTSIPAALAGSSVTSGDGNHAIDPNDCNSLELVITNQTGSPMTGISATLSTTTEGVIISQPCSIYPNIAAHGQGTNLVPFQISTLPSFVCGTPINIQLSANSSLGSFTMNSVLTTGGPGAPIRFDNNTITNVPDVGTIESTNYVASWSGGPITKVKVSLWLGTPIDADMTLSLIAPDGTTVQLASGVGDSNPDFGTASADGSRTTFDDAAGTSINSGTAPFVGTFSPQTPLSAFIATSPIGAWAIAYALNRKGDLRPGDHRDAPRVSAVHGRRRGSAAARDPRRSSFRSTTGT